MPDLKLEIYINEVSEHVGKKRRDDYHDTNENLGDLPTVNAENCNAEVINKAYESLCDKIRIGKKAI